MVNNNKQQNTNVSTGTVSESNIYLKKSELPKDISSFRNDVGYISSSTLATWLKEHSFISKNEINNLISQANLVVIDTVNRSADADAINRLEAKITDMAGEIVAIKDRLSDVEHSFISVDKEGLFATKSDIRSITNKITNISNNIDQINTDSSNFATKDEIPSLDGYATQSWVEGKGYLTKHQSLSGYAKKSDIPNVSGLATKDEIPTKVSQLQNDKGYLTSHQSLSGYAKKSDIPNVSGFATKEWVNEQGFLTDTYDLSTYAKKSDLTGYVTSYYLSNALKDYAKKNTVYTQNEINSTFLKKSDAENKYLSKSDAENKYLTKSDAIDTYLNIEDYRGLKDATLLSDKYKNKNISTLEQDLDTLRDGFYIVAGDNVVVVKNHQIFYVNSGGGGSISSLVWEEE